MRIALAFRYKGYADDNSRAANTNCIICFFYINNWIHKCGFTLKIQFEDGPHVIIAGILSCCVLKFNIGKTSKLKKLRFYMRYKKHKEDVNARRH